MPLIGASAGPVAVIDGTSCVALSRYLRVVTPALEASGRLDAIRPALDAIAAAAEAQRAQDRQAFAAGAMEGWVTVAEAADLAGVSERAIRARLARGSLAGQRRGRSWKVDASELAERPA
jgi:excisionase family DNA binding protein